LSLLRFTASDYLFIILWPLSCLSLDLRRLITSLVSFGHCLVSPLNLFGILLPLSCLSFDLRLLIISLVSCGHFLVSPLIYGFWLPLWYLLVIVLSLLWFTASDYLFGIFKLFLQIFCLLNASFVKI
jgi:hypothetical protein